MAYRKSRPNKPFKVGDKIIDFGQVYRIFKIEKKKNAKGEEEKVIHFKPYFETTQNKKLTCSIHVKNISLTHIRRPISKNKLKELLKKLAKRPRAKKPINTTQEENKLKLNDPFITAQILKRLWLDKNDESTSFTTSKKNLLNLAMKRLVEEVAFVFGISVAQAKEKIKSSFKVYLLQ